MNQGVVLFAHNTEHVDYFKMAAYTASRINKFLDLPVSVITDYNSITSPHNFDHIIYQEPDLGNKRKQNVWINKGRYEIFDLTPYSDTLLVDTDYMVNSRSLKKLFKFDTDFMCYKNCKYLMEDNRTEYISKTSLETYWATVVRFQKTNRTQQIFSMIKMIQENYNHYANLHGFVPHMYRNDYALTMAVHTVDGHIERPENFIPGKLLHVNVNLNVERLSDTEYKIIYKDKQGKTTYTLLKECDFHMLSKGNFMEIAQ